MGCVSGRARAIVGRDFGWKNGGTGRGQEVVSRLRHCLDEDRKEDRRLIRRGHATVSIRIFGNADRITHRLRQEAWEAGHSRTCLQQREFGIFWRWRECANQGS